MCTIENSQKNVVKNFKLIFPGIVEKNGKIAQDTIQ